MPLAIPIEQATNEADVQAYEIRKRDADAKGIR